MKRNRESIRPFLSSGFNSIFDSFDNYIYFKGELSEKFPSCREKVKPPLAKRLSQILPRESREELRDSSQPR